jgi:hypothetical protein
LTSLAQVTSHPFVHGWRLFASAASRFVLRFHPVLGLPFIGTQEAGSGTRRGQGPRAFPDARGPLAFGEAPETLFGSAVLRGMVFGGFLRMVGCIKMMPMRYVRGIGSLFVVASFVVIGGFLVMFSCMLVMFCCLPMVLRSCMISHTCISFQSEISQLEFSECWRHGT